MNDRRGHAVGDRVLVAIAERLRGCIGPDDVVGRIAGDEFAVLLEQVGTEAAAEAIAARVTEVMREPFVAEGHEAAVSLSIGVALSNDDDSVESLLSRADLAMYAAKREGGVACATPTDGTPPASSTGWSWRRTSSGPSATTSCASCTSPS